MNNYINSKLPTYDPVTVQPMRDELISAGFEEVTTPQMVEDVLAKNNDETILVFINSVCGCAAGSARPGVIAALQNNIIPDRFITAFAGQDRDAIDIIRAKYLTAYPPSSPSMALIRNSEVLFMMPRHQIDSRTPEQVAELLTNIFEQHCSRQGPSIPKEEYVKLMRVQACGSNISMN